MENFIVFAVIRLKFPRVGLDEKGLGAILGSKVALYMYKSGKYKVKGTTPSLFKTQAALAAPELLVSLLLTLNIFHTLF